VSTPEHASKIGATPGPSFRETLKNRDFTLLWIGQLGSEVGNGAIQIALPWMVLQLTGSAFQLGLAYFIQFMPMLLFGIIGGVFVDRWDRRMTMVVVDAMRSVAFLSVGIIYYLDGLLIEHLYLVIFLEASLATFFNPARAALMPNLVKPDDLRAANSLMEVARNLGFLIAPTAGSFLIALIGPAAIILGDGITFLVSGICVYLIKYRSPPRERVASKSFREVVSEVLVQTGEGMKAIGSKRLLQVAVFLGLALNMIVAPIQVLLPLFVREVKHGDASYFGILVGGLLLGLLAGSLLAPQLSRRIGLGKMAIGAVVSLGVVMSIAAWPPTIAPPLIAMIISGVAIGSLNVAQTTMLQGSTTDEERGRVSATYFTATQGLRPFGFLLVGALAEAVDIRLMFVALGLMAISVGIFLGRMQEVREAH
jgi:MFS family permease